MECKCNYVIIVVNCARQKLILNVGCSGSLQMDDGSGSKSELRNNDVRGRGKLKQTKEEERASQNSLSGEDTFF